MEIFSTIVCEITPTHVENDEEREVRHKVHRNETHRVVLGCVEAAWEVVNGEGVVVGGGGK